MSTQVRDEAPRAGRWEWRELLPATASQARGYAERAIDIGIHPTAALGFYHWCIAHLGEEPPITSHATGSKYRKVLLRLAQDRLKGQPDAALVEYTGHDALLERAARREIRATRQNVESRLAAA